MATRAEQVIQWEYIQFLSSQIIHAGGWKKWEHHVRFSNLNSKIGSDVETMVSTIRNQRGQMKGVDKMTPHKMVKIEKDIVERLIRSAMYSKRGSRYIYVDGRRKEITKRLGDYSVYVGPMWKRRVYNTFYKNRLNQKGKHEGYIKRYFILDAHEVRSTAPEIHLYRVEYYDFQDNKNLSGYVGQSKIGKRHASAPKKTAREAITAGIQLTSANVSERLLTREDN